jgi:UDP-N-acetylglucosamine acyltransferase
MPQIHPSSVVEPGARIAESASIGPFCYIGAKVVIGAGTRLVSHITVLGRTTIGERNVIWSQAVLGADPQDLKYRGEDSALVIGDHNQIRELVTIHLGTDNGGGVTRIGGDNLIMAGAHVAHDCEIGNHVLIANNVALAGHVKVEDNANIAGVTGIHHFVTIGQFSYTGGMSRVVHDVPPFMLVEGDPAAVRQPNFIGLERHGFPPESVRAIRECFRRIYRPEKRHGTGEAAPPRGSLDDRLAALEREFVGDECVQIFVGAVRRSASGAFGRHLEGKRRDERRKSAEKAI